MSLSKPIPSTKTHPVDDDSGPVAKGTNKEQIDVKNAKTRQLNATRKR
jgi:hypothetical protein